MGKYQDGFDSGYARAIEDLTAAARALDVARRTPASSATDDLKTRRLHFGMSQAELAERMTQMGHSWHTTTVGKLERGQRKMQAQEWDSVRRILPIAGDAVTGAEVTLTKTERQEIC